MATAIGANFDPFAKLIGSSTSSATKKDVETPVTAELIRTQLTKLPIQQNRLFRRSYNLLRNASRKVKDDDKAELVTLSRRLIRRLVREESPTFDADEKEISKIIYDMYFDNNRILDAITVYSNIETVVGDYIRGLRALAYDFPQEEGLFRIRPNIREKMKGELLSNFLKVNPDVPSRLRELVGTTPASFKEDAITDPIKNALLEIGTVRPLRYLFDQTFNVYTGECGGKGKDFATGGGKGRAGLEFDKRIQFIFPDLNVKDIYALCDFSAKYKDYT